MNLRYFVFILWVLVGSVAAWWDNGHLLVARIAQTELHKTARSKLTKAQQILGVVQKRLPNLTYREKNHPFVATATFGDFFKYKGGMYQKQWHFTNIPYRSSDKKAPKHAFKKDIVSAINSLAKIVKGAPGYGSTYEYKEILNGLSNVQANQN